MTFQTGACSSDQYSRPSNECGCLEAESSPFWCRQSTRNRLKLIPRVANAEQWAKDAPLSTAEYKLLSNYNDKPVLTRPQHRFYFGANYMEIDLDIHAWAYLARKAFSSYIPRLGTVVFENAFVVQVKPLLGTSVIDLSVRLHDTDYSAASSNVDWRFWFCTQDSRVKTYT